jgi:hypothetical protein
VDRARETTKLALGFGVHQLFTIARSHYTNIDLVAMSQGYASGYTEAQLDEIEKAAASPTRNLANQIEDEIVLK